ncbi:RNA polymerase primary sigma factor [Pedobacter sp. CG_S7]|uniref:sigma-70 family RNA polymerase sigma factor n=1 Tax=Pedobacter sp. CG_S7 TaxID=3143930 RepID=UPI0033937124
MRQLKIGQTITSRDSASLDKYLSDIGKIGLLSVEEESNLAKRVRDGDLRAMDLLVSSNLRFVVSVAKKYQHRGMALGDLINEGNLGLIKAAQRFNETKGFKFISFAVWWIRQAILQALSDQTRIVRLPLNQISSIIKLNKATLTLEQDLERVPSSSELSDFMDVDIDKVEEYLNIARLPVSLDAIISDEIGSTLLDTIADNSPGPDCALLKDSFNDDIRKILDTLPLRERNIIILYFGLGNSEPIILEEIAIINGLSKERVRQLKDKALKELRRRAKSFKNNILNTD